MLQPLTAGEAVTAWTFDPMAVAVIVGAAAAYAVAARRVKRQGDHWPVMRSVSFAVGLLSIAVVTVWWIGAYAHSLFWVYTIQIMVLLVISPALLMFGRPVTLARAAATASAKQALLARVADSPPIRLLSTPALGPLLLPVVTGLVFFTALFPASLSHDVVYELVHVLLLVSGMVIALPLAGEAADSTSLTIAAGILFGFLELLADAVPGIAIRLRTSLLAPEHYVAVGRKWGPSLLHDQQLGGAIVWFLAETIDLPVLALLVLRWIRADEREAVLIDRHLDEQQAAQGPLSAADPGQALQRPWWESDASVFGDRREAALRRPARRGDEPSDAE